LKVGIVGCGLIGKRRAQIAHQSQIDEVIIVADIDETLADTVATEFSCQSTKDWQDVVTREYLDIVVVATSNKFLMPIVVAALENGKHVLCEKPPGRNFTETQKMVETAKNTNRKLKIGFNHRHHPAVWKAHEISSQGTIGSLMFIRAIYGHGGRPGYDKEWRADAELSGGGELLDQGVHVIDLCRWFLGDFAEAIGFTSTYFWDLGFFRANGAEPQSAIRQLEDNAFAALRTSQGQIAQFHTSWTQWKNRFSFEVFGRDGYVRIEGLGGSYGVETLEIGKRKPEGGAPEVEKVEFPGPDLSWQAEWQEFTAAIREGRQPLANGEDGLQTMRTIAAIYESAHTGRVLHL
jgi:predicted dehydrogenase